MQISGGTCTVTLGSQQVVASPYNDWSDAQNGLGQGSPIYFSLIGITQVPIQVIAVIQPGLSSSGNWELTLVVPWPNPSTTNINGDPYVIQKDFTANLHLPMPSGGDRQWAQFLARAFQIIDAAISGTSPVTPPAAASGIGVAIINVQPTSTLYISDELDIQVGLEYDILAGGKLEIG